MADFAPNYTVRYRLKYSVLGLTHKAQVRAARGSGIAGALGARDRLIACINALASVRYVGWTAISGEYSLEDSNLFFPDGVLPAVTAGATAVPANPKSESIVSLGFVGRSQLGTKARLFLYGVALSPEGAAAVVDDFRLNAGNSAPLDAAIAALSAGVGTVGNDNTGVVWYTYANTKYNDYWLRRIRA